MGPGYCKCAGHPPAMDQADHRGSEIMERVFIKLVLGR